jgi:hypothetical protein
MIGLIILVALYRLTFSVIAGLLFGMLDPLDQNTHLLGLAAIALVLGVVYWLMRERDDRLPGVSKSRD